MNWLEIICTQSNFSYWAWFLTEISMHRNDCIRLSHAWRKWKIMLMKTFTIEENVKISLIAGNIDVFNVCDMYLQICARGLLLKFNTRPVLEKEHSGALIRPFKFSEFLCYSQHCNILSKMIIIYSSSFDNTFEAHMLFGCRGMNCDMKEK